VTITTAPLPPAEVERALAPLGEARMLPTAAYTDHDVLAWEREHLFARSWVCVGRSDEPEHVSGAQRAVALGIGSALLVRDESESLRAFANVCRHRGHELLPVGTSAAQRSISCPYHGWTYALDGALVYATGGGVTEAAECALGELRVADWLGWTFVDERGSAPSLAEHFGGLTDVLAPYDPARLSPVARREYVVAANWKVVHENYQECLHCPRIHPELCKVSPPNSGDNLAPGSSWVGGWMDLRPDAETMSMTGAAVGPTHPGYVLTHRLEPIGPAATRVECEWLADPETTSIDGAVELWDLVNRQDWAACESVQRGLASGAHRPGPIVAREDAVHHFVGLVARAYLGRSNAGQP
jgi:glycine betaine catabolism A